MLDKEGNILAVGMVVYVLTTASDSGRTRKLMRGKVHEIDGNYCTVYVDELKKVKGRFTKTTVIRPIES